MKQTVYKREKLEKANLLCIKAKSLQVLGRQLDHIAKILGYMNSSNLWARKMTIGQFWVPGSVARG